MSKSPKAAPIKTKHLDFYTALKAIMGGETVSKEEWADRNIYGYLKDGRLTIRLANTLDHDWILTDGDVYGDDYFIR